MFAVALVTQSHFYLAQPCKTHTFISNSRDSFHCHAHIWTSPVHLIATRSGCIGININTPLGFSFLKDSCVL